MKFLIERWKDGKEPLFYVFSFTLLIASIFKYRYTKNKDSVIKIFNKVYFIFTLVTSFILLVCTLNIDGTEDKLNSLLE